MAENISYLAQEITSQLLEEAKNYHRAIVNGTHWEISHISAKMDTLVKKIKKLYPDKKEK